MFIPHKKISKREVRGPVRYMIYDTRAQQFCLDPMNSSRHLAVSSFPLRISEHHTVQPLLLWASAIPSEPSLVPFHVLDPRSGLKHPAPVSRANNKPKKSGTLPDQCILFPSPLRAHPPNGSVHLRSLSGLFRWIVGVYHILTLSVTPQHDLD